MLPRSNDTKKLKKSLKDLVHANHKHQTKNGITASSLFLTNKQCQLNKLSRVLKTFARSGCIPCRPKILMTSFSKSLFLLLSEQIVSKLLCDKKIT